MFLAVSAQWDHKMIFVLYSQVCRFSVYRLLWICSGCTELNVVRKFATLSSPAVNIILCHTFFRVGNKAFMSVIDDFYRAIMK
jgi:hypothetical protein